MTIGLRPPVIGALNSRSAVWMSGGIVARSAIGRIGEADQGGAGDRHSGATPSWPSRSAMSAIALRVFTLWYAAIVFASTPRSRSDSVSTELATGATRVPGSIRVRGRNSAPRR